MHIYCTGLTCVEDRYTFQKATAGWWLRLRPLGCEQRILSRQREARLITFPGTAATRFTNSPAEDCRSMISVALVWKYVCLSLTSADF